jgi:hypothetical protein
MQFPTSAPFFVFSNPAWFLACRRVPLGSSVGVVEFFLDRCGGACTFGMLGVALMLQKTSFL